jgi:hypothetical protein
VAIIYFHSKLYNIRTKQYIKSLFTSCFVKTNKYNFNSYEKITVLTKNNYSFIILRTLNLVRTGFCNWGNICQTLDFCPFVPLKVRGNNDYGHTLNSCIVTMFKYILHCDFHSHFCRQVPKEQAVTQEKQLLANYLSCSGSINANSTSATCLERLTCELHHPGSDASQLEKHVMSM